MAKIDFKGIEEYSRALAEIGAQREKIIEQAVYGGAAVVADEIRAGIEAIPIEEGENGLPPVGTPEHKLTGVSRRQKADLLDGFGLAPIQNDGGYIQTKAGMDGYGSVKTKKYPKGTPNSMLMRGIESGTTFREKNPVMRKAANRSRKKSIKKMGDIIDEQMKERFKGGN